MSKHSPLPWRYNAKYGYIEHSDEDGYGCKAGISEADKRFIVLAVNHFGYMREAMAYVSSWLKGPVSSSDKTSLILVLDTALAKLKEPDHDR